MKINHRDPVILGFIAAVSLWLTACSPNIGTATGASGASSSSRVYATTPTTSNPAPSGGTGGGATTSQLSAPLQFTVDGVGNHARHICVPATQKLVLRVMPHTNTIPLFPPNTQLVSSTTGRLLYDGSPAYFSKLRVRLSIPGTSAAWDYLANVESWSVAGDYSSFLGQGTPATNVPSTPTLAIPEYDQYTKTIWGSSPLDGQCTYWEAQLGNCSQVSSSLRASESATCPSGQQKILITNVVSDYPCQNDPVGWCKGGAVQTVPDYQHWNVTIQAETENTASF